MEIILVRHNLTIYRLLNHIFSFSLHILFPSLFAMIEKRNEQGYFGRKTWRLSSPYAVVMFRKICVQFGTEFVSSRVHVCIQGNPAEIQKPGHWNLISRCMTALLSALSPSNIYPPLSSYWLSFPQGRFQCAFRKRYFYFFKNRVSLK